MTNRFVKGSLRTRWRYLQMPRQERIRREQRESQSEHRGRTRTGRRRPDIRRETENNITPRWKTCHNGMQSSCQSKTDYRVVP
jgi:hypothetical protein